MPDSIPPTLPSERIPRVKTFPDAAAPAKPAIVPLPSDHAPPFEGPATIADMKRSVLELAGATDHTIEILRGPSRRPATIPDRWHAAAAALHGWVAHEHHTGAPMQLTQHEYLAAIEAAKQPDLVPHPPAVSPHSPHARRSSR